MPDREKVINGLVHQMDGCMFTGQCGDCPYKDEDGCLDTVLHDAIVLLKEQEEQKTAGDNKIPLKW